jgi:hypothetical protein
MHNMHSVRYGVQNDPRAGIDARPLADRARNAVLLAAYIPAAFAESDGGFAVV